MEATLAALRARHLKHRTNSVFAEDRKRTTFYITTTYITT